eukprot:TRINITY_DN37490_c0_g1_i1.p2 TRINITY_DN37490_c0_g1~~TRINITY_DN37490_c0_g1_i1.p2  ORF type:complete len:162 (+),score=42.47 TRINITY_DN37490_c0_g1_i1:34-519(+)
MSGVPGGADVAGMVFVPASAFAGHRHPSARTYPAAPSPSPRPAAAVPGVAAGGAAWADGRLCGSAAPLCGSALEIRDLLRERERLVQRVAEIDAALRSHYGSAAVSPQTPRIRPPPVQSGSPRRRLPRDPEALWRTAAFCFRFLWQCRRAGQRWRRRRLLV